MNNPVRQREKQKYKLPLSFPPPPLFVCSRAGFMSVCVSAPRAEI